jgi:hypothetical protein
MVLSEGLVVKIKPGDIFSCAVDGFIRYFQYVANDPHQLNANVIVVFVGRYDSGACVRLDDLLACEVDFVVHVDVKAGIKSKLWQRVGEARPYLVDGIAFRDTNDYGVPGVKVSDRWWIWTLSSRPVEVGSLTGKNRLSYVGIVRPPIDVVARIQSGTYGFFYPAPSGDGDYWV